MSERNIVAASVLSGFGQDHSNPENPSGTMESLRYFARPLKIGLTLKIGLIGLAVAVALWGFAYKLSLYLPFQGGYSRTSIAKMWFGPEELSAADANRRTSQSHKESLPQAALNGQRKCTTGSPHEPLPALECGRTAANQPSLLSSRSPPTNNGPANRGAAG